MIIHELYLIRAVFALNQIKFSNNLELDVELDLFLNWDFPHELTAVNLRRGEYRNVCHIHGLQNHRKPDDFHKNQTGFCWNKKQILKNTKIRKTEW
jgi:hypothetical protein